MAAAVSGKASKAVISAAVILNRAPILTRPPEPFETAYYAYQARLRRALHNPFPHSFYFKEGSLLETRFNMEEQQREKRAFGPVFLKQTGKTKADISNAEKEALEQLGQQVGYGETAPRRHPADESNDVKSLDRSGQRNLYLLLQALENGKQIWRFPQGGVRRGQALHQAAQQDLYAECGENMDTWIVSRCPIGIYKPPPSPTSDPVERITFFFKAHIMAGLAQPAAETVKDVAWLTKEEIETRVEKDYWEGVKDMLSDF